MFRESRFTYVYTKFINYALQASENYYPFLLVTLPCHCAYYVNSMFLIGSSIVLVFLTLCDPLLLDRQSKSESIITDVVFCLSALIRDVIMTLFLLNRHRICK